MGYRTDGFASGVHVGLPSRHLTFVIEIIDPLVVRGLGVTVAAHGIVGGLHTRPVLIDAARPQEGIQYALSPLGVRALLHVDAAALRDQLVDLADIVGARAVPLLEQVHATKDWHHRFRLVDEALTARFAEVRARPRPEVVEAWRLIMRTGGRETIGDVAAHVGWGRKHLARQFRQATGLTPKEAARIARFESAVRLLKRPTPPSLAEVAFLCGYADQPHLARDWRSFTGGTISSWLRNELPFVHGARGHGSTASH